MANEGPNLSWGRGLIRVNQRLLSLAVAGMVIVTGTAVMRRHAPPPPPQRSDHAFGSAVDGPVST